ncbi:MAG: ribonuclease HII [Anaerolineaceae bacterium]|nr:ribonuclease HII [Anaerolineaceae bacterium]
MRKRYDLSQIPEKPNLEFEKKLWGKNTRFVAGLDEAGRGALAGPLISAAVILPWDDPDLLEKLEGVRDSKQLTARKRANLVETIQSVALYWAYGRVEAEEIDQRGISLAGQFVFMRAIESLAQQPEHLLLDFFAIPQLPMFQTAIVKGDQRSLSIACASVLAKEARDAEMRTLDEIYPGYRFSQNKGYGTLAHREAIERFNACPQHRRTFTLLPLQLPIPGLMDR